MRKKNELYSKLMNIEKALYKAYSLEHERYINACSEYLDWLDYLEMYRKENGEHAITAIKAATYTANTAIEAARKACSEIARMIGEISHEHGE